MAKKTKGKLKDFNKVWLPLIIAGAIIIVIIILLVIPRGGKPEGSAQTCDQLCKNLGYTGATVNSCIELTSCQDPHEPLLKESEDICTGEFEVCCCKLGL